VTRKNASPHQLPQAPDRHLLARIATQSATQFDLVQVREKRIGEPFENMLEIGKTERFPVAAGSSLQTWGVRAIRG
jgi:hypothetical protein